MGVQSLPPRLGPAAPGRAAGTDPGPGLKRGTQSRLALPTIITPASATPVAKIDPMILGQLNRLPGPSPSVAALVHPVGSHWTTVATPGTVPARGRIETDRERDLSRTGVLRSPASGARHGSIDAAIADRQADRCLQGISGRLVVNASTFDTLAAARELEAAGVERSQAEVIAAQLRAAAVADLDEFATKADITALRVETRIIGVLS